MEHTTTLAHDAVKKAGMEAVLEKVEAKERLTREEGIALFGSSDLLALGWLARLAKERASGRKAFFVYNQHLNYSNVCTNNCRFCAFGRPEGRPGAFRLSIDEAGEKIEARWNEPICEIHIVGGVDPKLPLSYYVDLLKKIRDIRPQVHLKAFTAVEIAHMADISGMAEKEVLSRLKDAGLESMPGGGAEVFSPRVRSEICPRKIDAQRWLHIHRTAHGLGIRTNATMLFGHVETVEERVDHLIALRKLQDETGGFMAFIPLAFHPKNTGMSGLPPATGFDHLKTIALSRLMLDNFPHIKAYWVMMGLKLAQTALSFGADDLDGTIMEEKITRMAGGESEQSLTRRELKRLITAAGLTPVERDTFYHEIG